MPLTLVVLAKHKDIFAKFWSCANTFIPNYDKILVRDGTEISDPGPGWRVIQGPPKFSMAGNANLGWRAVDPKNDILYIGDDVLFDRQAISKLWDDAVAHPEVGIMSPKIKGPCCNPLQVTPPRGVSYSEKSLAFICIYVKRALIEKIGYLDEQFNNYGFDDNDFCLRTQIAGFKLGITSHSRVIHTGHATFSRGPWISDGQAKFYKKWGGLDGTSRRTDGGELGSVVLRSE